VCGLGWALLLAESPAGDGQQRAGELSTRAKIGGVCKVVVSAEKKQIGQMAAALTEIDSTHAEAIQLQAAAAKFDCITKTALWEGVLKPRW